jgi:hypothetical protein
MATVPAIHCQFFAQNWTTARTVATATCISLS